MYGAGFWGELAAVPIDTSYQDSVTAVSFDGLYELLWAGSVGGRLLTFQCPTLDLCSFWPGHTHPVISLTPLSGSDLCLSVAADSALLCNSGGVKRSGYVDKACSLLCGCLEPGAAAARLALLGCSDGQVLQMDLATGKMTTLVKEVLPGEGIAAMKPGLGRGQIALATTSGKLLLADPRAGFKVDPSSVIAAHAAGVSALEVRDGHVACCGYAMRAGVPSAEPYVKVYDVRGSLMRPLLNLPFTGPGGSPSCLAFHPQMPAMLLVGCSRGTLCMADTGVGATVATYQVETGGTALTSCVLGSIGEVWALGDMLGCVRLWAETNNPRVHAAALHAQMPSPIPRPPVVQLNEWDSLSLAQKPALDPAAGTRLLSDVDANATMSVGLAPRVIDSSLLPIIKQVDFVGHAANPYYVRGEPYGVATTKVGVLRNKRVDMKLASRSRGDGATQRAERARKRVAEGGVLLPLRFQRVEVRAQSGLKFEEFDFTFYNRTRFAGLENDLPNAYANALIQVLYFTPELRSALLSSHIPEPDTEFCLSCELSLLFRMMAAAHGTPVQAANLLRALRQMREAAALGLLDANVGGGGSVVSGASEAAHDMTGVREWALGRRCAALSRFLLETLIKEGNAAKAPHNNTPPPRSGIIQPAASNATLSGLLERLFALPTKQTLQCLTGPLDGDGHRPHRCRDTRVMQVDLLYPSHKSMRSNRQQLQSGLLSTAAPVITDTGASSPRTPRTPGQPGSTNTSEPFTSPATTPPPKSSTGSTTNNPLTNLGVAAPNPNTMPNTNHLSAGSSSPRPMPASPSTPCNAGLPASPTETARTGDSTFEPHEAPSFADLLQISLGASHDTRAWFDDSRGYAMVRCWRTPSQLPEVLVVGCAVAEPSDIAWWLPERQVMMQADGSTHTVETQRLPWAVRIEVKQSTGDIRVRQGSHASLLACLPSSFTTADEGQDNGTVESAGVLDAVYELCAVVAQIRDMDEEGLISEAVPKTPGAIDATKQSTSRTSNPPSGTKVYEGHLVAMVRVPSIYWDEAAIQSACVSPPIGSGAPLPPPMLGLQARQSAQIPHAKHAAGGVVLPDLDQILLSIGILSSNDAATTLTLPDGVNTKTSSNASTAESRERAFAATSSIEARSHPVGSYGSTGSPHESPKLQSMGDTDDINKPATKDISNDKQQQQDHADGQGAQSSSCTQSPPTEPINASQQGWLLLNDFSVSPLLPQEVVSVYGGQKLPCLLHFKRVTNGSNGTDSQPAPTRVPGEPTPPPTIAPVLTAQEFAQLCRAPPLQGQLPVSGAPRFKPLDMMFEAPRPGMLLALDAEFVMVSAPERMLDANLEVLTRQSRLTLGRVSVLRGEGPFAGTPCIDDYVRAVEPVLDHLTRYSGLMPGDLDPSTSHHYLTTMKHAYLKLRYLVDVGCVLVGHGLKKDLRIINITVPPEQIVDTVELFSRQRQRKMSLRFLASYLLGTHIQSAVHDSVEDARTALRLYEMYKQLVAAGSFQAKLDELYNWGARYGWEPVNLDMSGQPIPPPPPTTSPAASNNSNTAMPASASA